MIVTTENVIRVKVLTFARLGAGGRFQASEGFHGAILDVKGVHSNAWGNRSSALSAWFLALREQVDVWISRADSCV